MLRTTILLVLLNCLIIAQQNKKQLNYAPGELIIKYEKSSESPRGQEILNEYKDIIGELKTILPNIKFKDYSPVFSSVVKEMITRNLTEEELYNKNGLNKKLKTQFIGMKNPEFSKVILLKTENPEEDIENLVIQINDNPSLFSKDGYKIIFAEPNYLKKIYSGTPDPLYNQQWSHQITNIEQAWAITQGNSQIKIAIIDTGVDPNHPDLKDNITSGGYDFVDIDTNYYKQAGFRTLPGEDYTKPDGDFSDFYGHGTHCAGIAAAIGDNGIGVKGVAPGCKILPVRAGFAIQYGANQYGLLESVSVINAIKYAVDNGARVISMSFGGIRSSAVEDAIKYAYYRNVVLIAGAGNENSLEKSYPAAYDEVTAVTAIDSNRIKTSFSNYGLWTDVAAPGLDIISTVPLKGGECSDLSGYKVLSGTSMAAPYVAGVAALLLSEKPNLTNEFVYQTLRTSVDPYLTNEHFYYGEGIINAFKTLSSEEPCVAKITSPLIFSNLIIRDQVDIYGKAYGKDFNKYILEYCNYLLNDTNWTSAGEFSTVVDSGYLGKVTIPKDGIYNIRLRVVSSNNKEYTAVIGPVTVDKKLKTNWPVETGFESVSSPAISDIDKDGIMETIFTSSNGGIYVVTPSAENKPGWPIFLAKEVTYIETLVGYSSPSVSDIDNDGFEEIIVKDAKNLYAFDYSGVIKKGWPIEMNNATIFGRGQVSSPVTADINNDGKKEILVTYFTERDLNNGKIIVVDYKGENLPGFPKIIPSREMTFTTPVVSDIDGDGKTEIIIQCFDELKRIGYLYLLDETGQILPGWPLEIATGSMNSPITADINNDGINEIIITSHIAIKENLGEIGIYAINKNATILNGFPASLNYEMFGYYDVTAGLSAGDINNDGYKEIIVGSEGYDYSLWAVNWKGSILWKFKSNIFEYVDYSSPLIADLNGDNKPEIVISKLNNLSLYGKILVVDNIGKEITELCKYIPEQIRTTPTIGDIDGDDKLELICPSINGNVYCWDYDAPYNQKSLIWPTYQQNYFRTGAFPVRTIAPSITELIQPLNNAENVIRNTEFLWNPADDALKYNLQISDQSSFTSNIHDTISLSEVYYKLDTLTLNANNKYYWRVRAINKFGNSEWSEVRAFTTSSTVGIKETNSIPKDYFISQNYPNPFNPVTEIRFGIPKESNVRITVFNILGKSIKQLLNTTRQAGYYNISFDASNLSSGIYFYIIESSALDGSKYFREVKKMMLIK